jgi:ABC-2 type transport system permease protein
MNGSLWNGSFVTLLKREFWENKALWIAPLVGVGLILFGTVFGTVKAPGDAHLSLPPMAGMAVVAGGLFAMVSVLWIIGCISVFTYLMDCLYGERKDRSILFWKSLPVSDSRTVLSKFTVAMAVVPVGLVALSFVTAALVLAVLKLRFGDLHLDNIPFLSWTELLGRALLIWVYSLLWYTPVAAYVMLASVLARRAPILYVLLPPVALILVERLFFNTSHVWWFVLRRLVPVRPEDGVPSMLGAEAPWQHFLSPALWLGLAAAAGMLYTVIRLRRYRDDT